MLTHELMGLWALGISWLTALLVALDLGIDVRTWLARRASYGSSLLVGTVESDELAAHEIEQRVRRLDGSTPRLGYWDRSHASHVFEGRVRVDGELVDVVGHPNAEVWTTPEAKKAAASLERAEFDVLYAEAKSARGALRTVRTTLTRGAPVWLVGERIGSHFEASLVSAVDPRPWSRNLLLQLFGVIALDFAWVTLGTVLALWVPHFGLVSTIGAIVLIGHFLGITPIAVAVRERCRTPALTFLRGDATSGSSLRPHEAGHAETA